MAKTSYINIQRNLAKPRPEQAFQTIVPLLFKLPTKSVDNSGEKNWASPSKPLFYYGSLKLETF